MRNPRTFLLGAVLLTGMASCNTSSTEPAEPVKEVFDVSAAKTSIEAGNSSFSAAFKSGDSTGLAAKYTSDAILMPPNGPAVHAEDIASFWGGVMRAGVKDAKLTVDDITGDGDLLAETGHAELFGENNAMIDEVKYVVVWKKVDGTWKMYRDIWSSINPPPPVK